MLKKTILLSVFSLSVSANMCLKGGASLEDIVANSVQVSQVENIVVKAAEDAATKWNALKTMNHCAQGRMVDKSFALDMNIKTIEDGALSGWLNENEMVAGEPTSYSFGKSGNGDLIFIQQVKTGDSLKANVVISMCQYSDGTHEFIGPNAKMSQFYLNQIVLGSCVDNETCEERELSSGQFGFHSEEYGGFVPAYVMKVQ
jgi:hypothetical protein